MGTWWHSTVRIVARRTLREFVESRTGHKDQAALKAALDAWFEGAQVKLDQYGCCEAPLRVGQHRDRRPDRI